MSEIKYVDLDGLSHFKSKCDATYVQKVTGKGLSTNDYTDTEKTKLAGIDEGAEVNAIESVVVNGQTATIAGKTASVTIETGAIDTISVNGTPQTIDANKNVNITVPTNNNQLTNGAGYQTASDVSSAINIDSISVNGTAKTPDANKNVNIPVPTNNNQLTNGAGYQTASDVNSAISSAIAGVTQFDYSIVQTLPASGVKGTIYLMSNSGTGQNNYDEYIWISNAWEKLGSLSVDLSGYVREEDLVPITNAEINALFA